MSASAGTTAPQHATETSAAAAREPAAAAPATADSVHPVLRLQASAGNQAVRALLGGGRPMPDHLRGEMEQRFGADFNQVRVHDHAQAHAAAEGIRAKAFTFGNDVAFARHRYAPDTAQGRKLMAHELAHVIQQSRGGGPLGSDAASPHESEADAAADAFVGGAPVSVRGATGLGIARAPEDAAEVDLHRPLDIGETREYRDSGGTAGKASRPTADVFVIETDLRAGQSTTRADYQTRALPTPEGLPNPKGGVTPVIPLGQGGFEKLHAIGPLLGHESPHGILYGPFTLNRQLMEHGIETYLSQLRDQLPPGGVLRLKVTVQRELGSGQYQGHEFLKSVSYSVDQIQPGVKPTPVFRLEILVDRPQDPNTSYDIGEARWLKDDPLKRVSSSSPKERRRTRVPDILPERDKKAARKLFKQLTGIQQDLDARRRQAPQGSTEADLMTPYANLLREALQAIESPDRMTQDELENLRQLHEDVRKVLKQLPRGRATQVTSPKTATAKAAKKSASPKVPDTGAPTSQAVEAKPLAKPADALHKAAVELGESTPVTPTAVKPIVKSLPKRSLAAPVAAEPTGPGQAVIPGPGLGPGGALPAIEPVPSADKSPAAASNPQVPVRSISRTPGERIIIPKPPGGARPWGKASRPRAYAPRPLTFSRSVSGALDETGWAGLGEMLGNGLERLNELGIRNRTADEVTKLKPQIQAYQEAHPQDGVLIAVQIETWDPAWRPSDARPTRSFVSVVPQYGGATQDGAMARWMSEPKFLRGSAPGSTIGTEFIWIHPGQHVSLSKTNFINGRYRSDSDPNRMLVFQFSDDGAFRCEAVNPRTGVPIRVEVVKPWTLELNDNSIRLRVRFFVPPTQDIVESEFSVLDTQWVQERWSTATGGSGDHFWQKSAK